MNPSILLTANGPVLAATYQQECVKVACLLPIPHIQEPTIPVIFVMSFTAQLAQRIIQASAHSATEVSSLTHQLLSVIPTQDA